MKHRWLILRGFKPVAADRHTWDSRGQTTWTNIHWVNRYGNVRTTSVDGHWTLTELFGGES